jgi:FlaA1/EpsC-like NDP-sugar epimerase
MQPPANLAHANTERKRVLVTGAAGFIGMHLSMELSKRNSDVGMNGPVLRF